MQCPYYLIVYAGSSSQILILISRSLERREANFLKNLPLFLHYLHLGENQENLSLSIWTDNFLLLIEDERTLPYYLCQESLFTFCTKGWGDSWKNQKSFQINRLLKSPTDVNYQEEPWSIQLASYLRLNHGQACTSFTPLSIRRWILHHKFVQVGSLDFKSISWRNWSSTISVAP